MKTMAREDAHISMCCSYFNNEFMELETYTHSQIKDETTSVAILSNPKLRSTHEKWLANIELNMDYTDGNLEHKMSCYKAWVRCEMGNIWL